MKLPVPFIQAKTDLDCGPLALQMVLAYFGKNYSIHEIAKAQKQLDTGLVWSAGIARAAKVLGFHVRFISSTNFDHQVDQIDYYKHYSHDKGMLTVKELHDELKQLQIPNEERNMSLKELLDMVTENSIPIVLVNWYVLARKEGFSGHFLPITGYDEEFVYVHNPGMASPQAHLPIKRERFKEAWESKGTDKDTVIVFRK